MAGVLRVLDAIAASLISFLRSIRVCVATVTARVVGRICGRSSFLLFIFTWRVDIILEKKFFQELILSSPEWYKSIYSGTVTLTLSRLLLSNDLLFRAWFSAYCSLWRTIHDILVILILLAKHFSVRCCLVASQLAEGVILTLRGTLAWG